MSFYDLKEDSIQPMIAQLHDTDNYPVSIFMTFASHINNVVMQAEKEGHKLPMSLREKVALEETIKKLYNRYSAEGCPDNNCWTRPQKLQIVGDLYQVIAYFDSFEDYSNDNVVDCVISIALFKLKLLSETAYNYTFNE